MTRKEFADLAAKSETLSEVLIAIGISPISITQTQRQTVLDRAAKDGIDVSHWKANRLPIPVIVGKVYNLLTAIEPAGKDKYNNYLWKFSCECGSQVTSPSAKVANGKIKSCGCLTPGKRKRDPETGAFLPFAEDEAKPGWIIAANAVWTGNRYSDGCSFEDFLRLSQEPCFYCGTTEKLNHVKRKGITWLWNGLDRLDPTKSHSLDNVVPCCKDCNYGKHTKQYVQFLLWIDRIYHHSVEEITRVKTQHELSLPSP